MLMYHHEDVCARIKSTGTGTTMLRLGLLPVGSSQPGRPRRPRRPRVCQLDRAAVHAAALVVHLHPASRGSGPKTRPRGGLRGGISSRFDQSVRPWMARRVAHLHLHPPRPRHDPLHLRSRPPTLSPTLGTGSFIEIPIARWISRPLIQAGRGGVSRPWPRAGWPLSSRTRSRQHSRGRASPPAR